MTFNPPERFNIADYFLGARLAEGRGGDVAILTDDATFTYQEVDALANRYGNLLRDIGVKPEQRVILALPDGPEFVAALFGTLRAGAVVVLVNPELPRDAIEYFFDYTRAVTAFVPHDGEKAFFAAAPGAPCLEEIMVVGSDALEDRLGYSDDAMEPFSTHRDDPAIWLFSGGTTGRPKAVIQTHASYANTTECYGKHILALRPGDVTLAVPKLFFGYAMGSNLFFPFAAGATCALFPGRVTPEVLFEKIAKFRPTLLINVPTMIQKMVAHPEAASQDLSSLRIATSAGEALPAELHRRWTDLWGVPLLDGLGTAEMWHIFLSNRPDDVKPGTLGKVVPGFDVRVRDDEGNDLPDGETGWLWVRGGSRAIGYWHDMAKTKAAFRGEWYVSGDMVRRDAEGYFTYCGRDDDMLKISGKWLAPAEVENCLVQHEAVEEAAVVGASDEEGLVKPWAFVLARGGHTASVDAIRAFVRERLEPYKCPREIVVMDSLPRTHLGKVDRGKLRAAAEAKRASAPRGA
ncbi:MAG: benzoate-CoA ligase family protein [bacterium]